MIKYHLYKKPCTFWFIHWQKTFQMCFLHILRDLGSYRHGSVYVIYAYLQDLNQTTKQLFFLLVTSSQCFISVIIPLPYYLKQFRIFSIQCSEMNLLHFLLSAGYLSFILPSSSFTLSLAFNPPSYASPYSLPCQLQCFIHKLTQQEWVGVMGTKQYFVVVMYECQPYALRISPCCCSFL